MKKNSAHTLSLFFPMIFFTIMSCNSETAPQSVAATPAPPQNQEYKTMLYQLQGTWQYLTDSTEYLENWVKINDTLMEGSGLQLVRKDTVQKEQVQLIFAGEDIYYNVKAIGQNNDRTVSFAFEPNHGDSLIFTNRLHDFPKFISYQFIRHDSVFAVVWGGVRGKVLYIPFPMKRMKS